MSTNLKTTTKLLNATGSFVWRISATEPERTYSTAKHVPRRTESEPLYAVCRESGQIHGLSVLQKKAHWKEKERRQGYMEAAIEQGVAWQVRLNRELRGMSQAELAAVIGTKQSSVSRMEDPTYGGHSLKLLTKVAHAFDCALLVKLISYSDLAYESQKLNEVHQYALPFEIETERFGGKEIQK